MKKKLSDLNNKIALWLTIRFGSMWVFYIFAIYGFLPLISVFHHHQDAFLYWSNWVQLISLPLIMVGTNLLSHEADERAKTDHETLKKSYEEQKEMDKKVTDALEVIQSVLKDMQKQDEELERQDEELKKQTEILEKGESRMNENHQKLDEQTSVLKEINA